MRILSTFVACIVVSGCATVAPATPAGPTLLEMDGADEGQAAALLGAYLVARRYTVRLAGDASLEATGPEGATFMIEVLLDPSGLDRLVLSRTYPAREGADPAALAAFAAELNSTLNVGVFSAYPPGILFQGALPFLDTLDPSLLEAFIDFTGEVRLAVDQVEAGRQLLVPVEGARGSG